MTLFIFPDVYIPIISFIIILPFLIYFYVDDIKEKSKIIDVDNNWNEIYEIKQEVQDELDKELDIKIKVEKWLNKDVLESLLISTVYQYKISINSFLPEHIIDDAINNLILNVHWQDNNILVSIEKI